MMDSLKGMFSKAEGSAGVSGGAVTAGAADEESAIGGLLGKGGQALPGLLDKLGAGGLSDTVQSWVGKGSNLPVSGAQIKSALDSDAITSVAAKLGVSTDAAADKIAAVLPGIIDKLTPDGMVPDPDALAAKVTGFIKRD